MWKTDYGEDILVAGRSGNTALYEQWSRCEAGRVDKRMPYSRNTSGVELLEDGKCTTSFNGGCKLGQVSKW